MRHAALALSLVMVATTAADARPRRKQNPKAEAKRHMDAGARAHKAGKFEVALTELQTAYDLSPDPKLLFAIAQVQVKLDRCADAVPNYEKFLASTKDAKKQAVVKQAIDACQSKLADSPTPAAVPVATTTEPTTAAPPPETAPVTAPAPTPVVDSPSEPAVPYALPREPGPPVHISHHASRSPWYKDPLGDALVVGGVAAGVTSLVFYLGARGSLDDAESATTLAEYDSAVDDARSKRTLSVVLAGGGALLIGAGILRYSLRGHHEARGVAVAPLRDGGLVTWTGGF